MNTYIKKTLGMTLMTSFIGLTACGKGFQVHNLGSSGSIQSVADVKVQIAEAEQATIDAQNAMAEAQAAIASISDEHGNIDIDLFAVNPGVAPQGLLSPIINKLQGVFDTVISKVKIVTQKFDQARAVLAGAMSNLDPSNPAHAALIQQINQALAQIDFFESQFHSAMQMLAGKLDLATAALNNLVNIGCSFIPIPGLCTIAGIIVDAVLLNDVKALIAHFKSQLLSL